MVELGIIDIEMKGSLEVTQSDTFILHRRTLRPKEVK